ncbi:ROK family protein [Mucilaginibacter lacusdianchii]|uniref:ROK family protein n=1 Tax=Mucilaginibacter lacusdianchii TaxID=2684211 RepID=UPI00131BCCED|nr:ROK family protein [Mucilaginibacter sp. JXJ CY 39]
MPQNISALVTNANAIKCLYYNEALSSSDISGYIGKSIPHAIKVLNELIKEGYVIEKGYASSSGGRKPLQYSLIPDTHYIVSVAISQFYIQIGMLDMNNRFVTEIVQHEFKLYDLQAEELAAEIEKFITQAGFEKNKILGIGVTMPGFIDPVKGINYTHLECKDQSLVEYLQQAVSLPVFIENDSTAIALGEQKFGAAMYQDDAMVINLGWGIGLGMIVNGKIFRGHSGLAGEFSHIPLVKNGKLCKCGKHGCLETEASLIAIISKAADEIRQGQSSSLANYPSIDADAIIEEAIKGDVLSVKLISEAAYHVGQCLAILIHIMNPATIIFSGKASVIGRLWMAPMQQAINEHCIPRLAAYTELVISSLASNAQLIGGAVLVVENIGKVLEDKMEALNKEININQ